MQVLKHPPQTPMNEWSAKKTMTTKKKHSSSPPHSSSSAPTAPPPASRYSLPSSRCPWSCSRRTSSVRQRRSSAGAAGSAGTCPRRCVSGTGRASSCRSRRRSCGRGAWVAGWVGEGPCWTDASGGGEREKIRFSEAASLNNESILLIKLVSKSYFILQLINKHMYKQLYRWGRRNKICIQTAWNSVLSA